MLRVSVVTIGLIVQRECGKDVLADKRAVVLAQHGVVEAFRVVVGAVGVPEALAHYVGAVFFAHGGVVRGDGEVAGGCGSGLCAREEDAACAFAGAVAPGFEAGWGGGRAGEVMGGEHGERFGHWGANDGGSLGLAVE